VKRKNGFIETSLKIFTHWSLHTTKDSPGFRERYPSAKNVHILNPVMAELTHPVKTDSKEFYVPHALSTTTSDLTLAWNAQEWLTQSYHA